MGWKHELPSLTPELQLPQAFVLSPQQPLLSGAALSKPL